MGKYQPLARYLENLPRDSWEASFEEIEEILGFNLPRSAHDQSAWWANAINSSQAKGWLPAGWWAEGANLTKGRVFLKRQSGNMTSTEIQKLWEKK